MMKLANSFSVMGIKDVLTAVVNTSWQSTWICSTNALANGNIFSVISAVLVDVKCFVVVFDYRYRDCTKDDHRGDNGSDKLHVEL